MSGSIQKAWVDGTTYKVKATSDVTENSEFETEGIATSGEPLMKSTIQVATVEGIELIISAVEKITLRQVMRDKEIIAFGYKDEEGNVYNASGRINDGGRTTAENTMTLLMIPSTDWEITAV